MAGIINVFLEVGWKKRMTAEREIGGKELRDNT